MEKIKEIMRLDLVAIEIIFVRDDFLAYRSFWSFVELCVLAIE